MLILSLTLPLLVSGGFMEPIMTILHDDNDNDSHFLVKHSFFTPAFPSFS
jgi:hypothetical protein